MVALIAYTAVTALLLRHLIQHHFCEKYTSNLLECKHYIVDDAYKYSNIEISCPL